MSSDYLIIGLGNPGQQYSETRHNAGFWFVDELAARLSASGKDQSRLSSWVARSSLNGTPVLLAKPLTFMNHSGQGVRAVADYYRIPLSRLLIAYDELDLPVGAARLKQGGGHGGHNGLRDVFRHLPDTEFLRLRLGIGHPGMKDQVTPYVLSRPPAAEERQIRKAIGRAVDVLPEVLSGRTADAMKTLHTLDTPEERSD